MSLNNKIYISFVHWQLECRCTYRLQLCIQLSWHSSVRMFI